MVGRTGNVEGAGFWARENKERESRLSCRSVDVRRGLVGHVARRFLPSGAVGGWSESVAGSGVPGRSSWP